MAGSQGARPFLVAAQFLSFGAGEEEMRAEKLREARSRHGCTRCLGAELLLTENAERSWREAEPKSESEASVEPLAHLREAVSSLPQPTRRPVRTRRPRREEKGATHMHVPWTMPPKNKQAVMSEAVGGVSGRP